MSEQNQHTPGPWTYDEIRTKEAHRCWCVLGEGGRKIALAPAYELGEEQEAEANARILTAALEMLEALGEIVDTIDRSKETVSNDYAIFMSVERIARTALKKVEGGE